MALHWIERVQKHTAIDENGCWLSSYAISHKGYSRVHHEGEYARLHRLSFAFFREEIPEGMMVCHSCDIRNCWNPQHLFLGTARDNNQDMMNKGRSRYRGTANPSAILDEDNVREIRARCLSGESHSAVGKVYGVHPSTISAIIRRKIWFHVMDEITHGQSSQGL